MATIAIAYATRHGHTAKIAKYLAAAVRRAGLDAQLLDTDKPPRAPHLERVDTVVVAAPIHAGGYLPSTVQWVRAHVVELNAIPTAFCSIGLAVASRTTDGRAQTQPIVEAFQRETGWRPGRTELVAGALQYTKYNFMVRFVMRRIAAANGGDVDTSRDYEYTDWGALDRFAAEVCRDAAQYAAARAVSGNLAVSGAAGSRT
jgi:menaquinone-dependent protoporphyrinogen oxidase